MGIGDWGLGIGDWGLGIGDWVRKTSFKKKCLLVIKSSLRKKCIPFFRR